MYRLYVIRGSHACRAAMLMLDHKRAPYRCTEILTLLHPLVARLHGFDAGGQVRAAGARRPPALRIGDRLATVPALACGDQRTSTNHGIARFLETRHPERPLLPADPERRAAVEAAERWANETLQMVARRVLLAEALRDPDGFSRSSADGRMGPLLYRQRLARRLIIPSIGRQIFATTPAADRQLLAELGVLLDRIDGWIAAGVLNGPELNVADLMVAPSLALVLYRPDVLPLLEGRPALQLVDRLLPEPAKGAAERSSMLPA